MYFLAALVANDPLTAKRFWATVGYDPAYASISFAKRLLITLLFYLYVISQAPESMSSLPTL